MSLDILLDRHDSTVRTPSMDFAVAIWQKVASYFWVVRDNLSQSLQRGIFTALATLSGLIIMRQGGPVILDALQPGIVEEVIDRFALWGLLWLILRNSLPKQGAWQAGLLAMLVHSFPHFDDLFMQSPLIALGMGAVLSFLRGLPLFLLAWRRGLESALAFHWIQDVVRFTAGF